MSDPRLMAGREGRWRWPWALLGNGLVLLLIFGFGAGLGAIGEFAPGFAALFMDFGGDDGAVFRPPRVGSFLAFATFGALLIVPVLIAMKLVHGWHVGRVLGPRGGFVWGDFGRAVGAWATIYAVATAVEVVLFPDRYVLRPVGWECAIWLALAAAVILPQAFAEDFLFIGYLGRLWGAILPLPFVVVPMTAVGFSVLHASNADVSVDPKFALAVLFFGQALSLMIYFRTGSLAACFGLHWINNLIALAVVSHQPGYKNDFAPVVYLDPVLRAGRSHANEPLSWLAVLVGFGMIWVLLTWRRSPFAIASRPLPETPVSRSGQVEAERPNERAPIA